MPVAIVLAASWLQAQAPAPWFVEVGPLPQRIYARQLVPVVVRVGFDPAFVRDAVVPLFAQPLDQPFQLLVPWLAGDPAREVRVVAPPAGARTQRVAVGDQVLPLLIVAAVERDGRRCEVLELHKAVHAAQPGPLELGAPSVRYAFATRFVEDFLRGRQAVDRQEAVLAGQPVAWTVQALPEPAAAGFQGAVGSFTVAAELATRPAVVGDAFTVHVVVRGDGDLAGLPPLPAPTLPGFHVQGVVERPAADHTVWALDVLALRAGDMVLPPIPFVAFAPQQGRYVTHTTAPLPLHVDPATSALPERTARLVAADADAHPAAGSHPSRPWWLVVLFVPLLAGARRRRRRRRAALEALQRAVAQGPAAAVAAFEALLAVHARTPQFAAATWERLARRRSPEAIAALRTAHARLEEAKFGGASPTWSELETVLAQAKVR